MGTLSLVISILVFVAVASARKAGANNVHTETYTSKGVPAFVINRDSRPDRLQRFLNQRGLAGLEVIRFKAIEISPEETPPVEAAGRLTRGELGCFKSHMKIWHKVVNERIEEALVFEDDANVQGVNIVKALGSCRSQLPQGWHIIFLGVNYFQKENDVNDCFVKQKQGSYGSHAYMVNRSGAARLLRSVERNGITMPVDIFLSSPACECAYFLLRGNNVKPFNLSDTDTQRLR